MTPTRRASWALVHALLQGLAFAFGFAHARDPDLGVHLANGRSILLTGTIPGHNALTFAEPDAPALQSQWLASVLFELAHQAAGVAGPILLKCAVVAATVAVVVDTARRLGARPSATLLAVALGVASAAERFVERPLVFSNLAVALIAWALASRLPPRRRAATIALILALTVHVHAGAMFGALLVLGAIAIRLAALHPTLRRLAHLEGDPGREAKELGVALLASAALAVLGLLAYHPHPLRVLGFTFEMAGDPFLHAHLVEFRPPTAFEPATLVAFWITAIFVAAAILSQLGRAPATVLWPMAFGLAIALRHVRFVDLFGWLAAPGLAWVLTRAMEPRPGRVRGVGVAIALSLCVLTGSALLVLERGDSGIGWNRRVFDRPLLEDLRGLGVRGPAFVQDGWAGAWLAFRYPEERVFFHPSFDAYSTRFFRDEYMATRDGEPGWDDTLDRHGVDLVLMKYTTPHEARRQGGRPNLRQRLARDPRWALVSFDDYGMAFARRDALGPRARAAIIEGLDPDQRRFFASPGGALPSLRALQARLPSPRAWTLTSLARVWSGRGGAGSRTR